MKRYFVRNAENSNSDKDSILLTLIPGKQGTCRQVGRGDSVTSSLNGFNPEMVLMPITRFLRLLFFLVFGFSLFLILNEKAAHSETAIRDEVYVGQGSYTTELPSGCEIPSDYAGDPVGPLITENITGAVPTNDWHSSLVWEYYPGYAHSLNMYSHPLALKAFSSGVGLSYPAEPALFIPPPPPHIGEYHYCYDEDLRLGVSGLNSPDTRLDDYSDWVITAQWDDGTRSLKVTMGHGIPFVYAEISGGDALIASSSPFEIWHNDEGTIGMTVNGHHYGIFAPYGSVWAVSNTLQSSLNDQDFFSIAILPDDDLNTLLYYRKNAYAFIRETEVSWTYDEQSAVLTTFFNISTELKETGHGNVNHALIALYPHQWLHSNEILTDYEYVSSRGVMKVFEGNSFSTNLVFNGILPNLPDMGGYDPDILYDYVNEVYTASGNLDFPDTYWVGKAMNRLAMLVPISEHVDHIAARDSFLDQLKVKLEEWFTAGGDSGFYYDETWGTLIGCPASFNSGKELNDHHFHYGYFLRAAATIARYDPEWAQQENWGGMVNLLIKDTANWEKTDTQFPFLRYFDPYAGHSWANGPACFSAGNNQESSSESLNHAAAIFLWGALTENVTVRDLGIFLYATEVSAVEQYYFNIDGNVFPENFDFTTIGILWADGGAYATWWTSNPEEIHGINFLPVTGGSLYLGKNPDYILTNYQEMIDHNGGPETEWVDIIWSFLALNDAGEALIKFEENSDYLPETGESKAHTYHWLNNLNDLGRLKTGIACDSPAYAVYEKEGELAYAAFNPGPDDLIINFSDGARLFVPSKELVVGDGTEPMPSPTPTITIPADNSIFAVSIIMTLSLILKFRNGKQR